MTRGSKKRSKLTLAKFISFLNIHTVEFSKKNTVQYLILLQKISVVKNLDVANYQ